MVGRHRFYTFVSRGGGGNVLSTFSIFWSVYVLKKQGTRGPKATGLSDKLPWIPLAPVEMQFKGGASTPGT